MHFVVKTDRPDPERGIPDKWDKMMFKKSVPKKNRPDTEASGYLASGYLSVCACEGRGGGMPFL